MNHLELPWAVRIQDKASGTKQSGGTICLSGNASSFDTRLCPTAYKGRLKLNITSLFSV